MKGGRSGGAISGLTSKRRMSPYHPVGECEREAQPATPTPPEVPPPRAHTATSLGTLARATPHPPQALLRQSGCVRDTPATPLAFCLRGPRVFNAWHESSRHGLHMPPMKPHRERSTQPQPPDTTGDTV